METKIFFYKCSCGQTWKDEQKTAYPDTCQNCESENNPKQEMLKEKSFSKDELFNVLNELAFDLPSDAVGDITRNVLNDDLKGLYDVLDYYDKTRVLESFGYLKKVVDFN